MALTALALVAFSCTIGCGEDPIEPSADAWDGFPSQFMQDHCVRCHQGGHSGGDYTEYEDVVADADVMRCGLAATEVDGCDDPMPPPRTFPTGPRPPEEEIERLIEWLEAGAPR